MKSIDAAMVRKMFLTGAERLDSQKEKINDLNVFPVPDGDTGTNMSMTIMSAAREVSDLEGADMESLARAIAAGSLRGARGNSGVIFSQLCRGFTKEMEGCESLDVHAIAKAAHHACETAYKAVMKPKEGTILTVAKGIAEKAGEVSETTDDVIDAVTQIASYAKEVLEKTPDMLPVLKEAGVVDSGGQGLVCVLYGFLDALTGKVSEPEIVSKATGNDSAMGKKAKIADDLEITFGYCTEFIILLNREFTEKDEEEFKAFLNSIGDSIVCVALDDVVKIHVHTDHPGEAFEKGLTYGQLTNMKVDNLREEVEENRVVSDKEVAAAQKNDKPAAKTPKPLTENAKEVAFVPVVSGSGLSDIFTDMGADGIVEGGQTMNPSTDDILAVIEQVDAKTIFILPNNSNIILAASQAAELVRGRKAVVIPTKTVPQGVSAVVSFDPTADEASNTEAMNEAIGLVKSGQITYAVRDTSIEGINVQEGDYIAINDNGLAASDADINDVMFSMLDGMVDESSELITLYFGEDVSEEDAVRMEKMIQEKYPGIETDLQNGSQNIYYYIVSVE